jgi:hypothetical protein
MATLTGPSKLKYPNMTMVLEYRAGKIMSLRQFETVEEAQDFVERQDHSNLTEWLISEPGE